MASTVSQAQLVELVGLFETALKESTPGEWYWVTTVTETHDEAVAFYREAISHHASGQLHGVQVRLDDGSERLIALTGNGPAAATHAKLIGLLYHFAPDLVEVFKGIIDREQPGNVTFAQVSDAAQMLHQLMTAPAVSQAVISVLSEFELSLFQQALDTLQRLPPHAT